MADTRKPRVGLLGGSFDPVHVAHIALAQEAMKQLSLDHVELIPAADPWQRESLNASAQHRQAMLELATAHHPRLLVNPVEIERGGKTYTYDTVSQLPDHANYIWILGADQLQNFCSWHRWQEILDYVTLAVARRPGSDLSPPAPLMTALSRKGRPLLQIAFAPQDISATEIRRRIAAGECIDGYVPTAVACYIAQHRLYQSASHE